MGERSCRLCLETSNDPCLNIFSEIGIETKMVEILSEHFKCNITEADPLPNVVCYVCWKTTEAFHDLYEKSKDMQQKFLNSLVKTEYDSIDNVCSADSKESHNTGNETESFKVERTYDNSESDNELLLNDSHGADRNEAQMNDVNDSNTEGSHDMDRNDDNIESVDESNTRNSPKSKRKRRTHYKRSKNEIDTEYHKVFNEHKQFLDMTCDCCTKVFESLDEARDHYTTEHNNPRGYIKSINGRKFYLRSKIIEHLARQTNPEKFQCMDCGRVYSTMLLLERHKIRHTNDSAEVKLHKQFMADYFDMSCDRCENIFTSLEVAKRHYKECHNGEIGYVKCCRIKHRTPAAVRDHIRGHLNPDTFTCEVCGKKYATHNAIVRHQRSHKMTREKSFICDICGKKCRDKKAIEFHLFQKHVTSEPKFECKICQKKFPLQSLLYSHMYGVHREKKASVCCEICGKSFYTNFHLNKHMLTHSDKSERLAERKQCEHCGEWLMTYSGIYYHKQLHSKEKAKCDECEMEFTNRQNLLTHIRHNHRAHKYKCSYCEKTYPIASKLRLHEVSHTRHKTYECKFCPKVFTVQSSRQTHTRRNHQEELKLSKTK